MIRQAGRQSVSHNQLYVDQSVSQSVSQSGSQPVSHTLSGCDQLLTHSVSQSAEFLHGYTGMEFSVVVLAQIGLSRYTQLLQIILNIALFGAYF